MNIGLLEGPRILTPSSERLHALTVTIRDFYYQTLSAHWLITRDGGDSLVLKPMTAICRFIMRSPPMPRAER